MCHLYPQLWTPEFHEKKTFSCMDRCQTKGLKSRLISTDIDRLSTCPHRSFFHPPPGLPNSPRPLELPAREADLSLSWDDLASYFAEKIEVVRKGRPRLPATPPTSSAHLHCLSRSMKGVLLHLPTANPATCAKIPPHPHLPKAWPHQGAHLPCYLCLLPQPWATFSQHKCLIMPFGGEKSKT